MICHYIAVSAESASGDLPALGAILFAQLFNLLLVLPYLHAALFLAVDDSQRPSATGRLAAEHAASVGQSARALAKLTSSRNLSVSEGRGDDCGRFTGLTVVFRYILCLLGEVVEGATHPPASPLPPARSAASSSCFLQPAALQTTPTVISEQKRVLTPSTVHSTLLRIADCERDRRALRCIKLTGTMYVDADLQIVIMDADGNAHKPLNFEIGGELQEKGLEADHCIGRE